MHSNNKDDYIKLIDGVDKLEIGKTYFSKVWSRIGNEYPSRYGYLYYPHKVVAKARRGTHGERITTESGSTYYSEGPCIGRHRLESHDGNLSYRLKDNIVKPHVQLSLFDYEE